MNHLRYITLLLALLPLQILAQPFSIGKQSVTLNDPARGGRAIGVDIYYPATSAGNNTPISAGAFPLLVIGHGFSMTVDAYENFWTEYVPQGYIVALPKTEVGPIPFPSHGDFGQDMSYTVDWFLARNADNASSFYQRLNSRVAALGHSMGGGCSFLATAQNPNINTIINFAAAETNPSAVAAAANVTVPALIFAASKDNVAPSADNQLLMYNALASGCKALVTITDGSHCGFAEQNTLCSFGETTVCIGCSFIDRNVQHTLQFRVITPWLQFYLKEECAGWAIADSLLDNPSGYTVTRSCVVNLPTASVTVSGSTGQCALDTTFLQANGSGTYLWSTGDTASNIAITVPGTYTLTVSGAYNCNATDSITITANNVVKPALQLSGSDELCSGDSVVISVARNYAGFQWSTGAISSSLSVSQPGYYGLTVTDANGCTANSDSVLITVYQPYLQPTITEQGDSLFASTGNIAYWTFNGVALSNYTGNFLFPLTDGEYQLAMFDSNGCEALSAVYTYETPQDTILGIDTKTPTFTLWPNPTKGMVQVISAAPVSSCRVYNTHGALVLQLDTPWHNKIDLSSLSPQWYFIQVESAGKTYIRKVLLHP